MQHYNTDEDISGNASHPLQSSANTTCTCTYTQEPRTDHRMSGPVGHQPITRVAEISVFRKFLKITDQKLSF